MAQYAPIVTPTEGATFELQESGSSDWLTLPGVAAVSESGNEAPTREVVTFAGTSQQVGQARPPTIEITISAYTPLHRTDRILRDALINNTLLNFRYTFLGQTLRTFSGAANTVAIATTGIVTTAGTSRPSWDDEEFGPGLGIRVGTRTYIIDSISADANPVVTVNPAPTTQVAATADYSIILPSVRRPSFVARVAAWANTDAGSESALATSLSLAPTAILPRMQIVST